MKKLLALLLAMMMVLSLFAACGEKEDGSGKEEKKTTLPEAQEKPVVEEATVYVPKGFTLGEVKGQTYENTFIKIGCRLPKGWTYLDDEAIQVMNNISADLVGDDDLSAYLKTSVFYTMMATSGSVENCNINMEKVDADKLESLDVKENYEKLLPMMEESYNDMGAENVNLEITTVKLDGKLFDCIYGSLSLNGVDMVQYSITIKCDGYMANLALTASNEENLEELLDCFYLLK